MAIVIGMLLAWLTLSGDPPTPTAAVAHPPDAANRWAEPTRGILAQRCGSCHLPKLPTSVPRALAVFDLTEEPWYGRLEPEQFGALMARVRGTGSIAEDDAAIVERFVRCARDHECPVEGP